MNIFSNLRLRKAVLGCELGHIYQTRNVVRVDRGGLVECGKCRGNFSSSRRAASSQECGDNSIGGHQEEERVVHFVLSVLRRILGCRAV